MSGARAGAAARRGRDICISRRLSHRLAASTQLSHKNRLSEYTYTQAVSSHATAIQRAGI